MWQWQNAGTGQEGAATAPPNTTGPQAGPQGPGELQDMLQMLDHHAAAAPFEDLNMFNTSFE